MAAVRSNGQRIGQSVTNARDDVQRIADVTGFVGRIHGLKVELPAVDLIDEIACEFDEIVMSRRLGSHEVNKGDAGREHDRATGPLHAGDYVNLCDRVVRVSE